MTQPFVAKSDSALAVSLGTDRKSLRRWRVQFPADHPADLNVAAWKTFLEENTLGPYSARMNYGERAPSPPSHEGESIAFGREEWGRRRDVLFEILELVESGFIGGRITLEEYVSMGNAALPHVLQLSQILNAGIDAPGYRARWKSLVAEASEPGSARAARNILARLKQ